MLWVANSLWVQCACRVGVVATVALIAGIGVLSAIFQVVVLVFLGAFCGVSLVATGFYRDQW
ncbi:hypothetical protein [Mycobacterium leprae]|uniref:hypothetical protein n=1 Tax=Mycobacterium leprae TaxID=1769 RepID=UPI000AF5AA2A|nr:hypothetical protein [Mycobacterium leprae]